MRISQFLIVSLCLSLFTINDSLSQERKIEISLTNNDSLETHTKKQLLNLLETYNLQKWIFTENIKIESGYNVVPRSHPVLTLNTRHLKDDDLLLSTFIHEQLHWYIGSHPQKGIVLDKIKEKYTNPKTTFPDGSGDAISTYYHILICYLEYQALKELLGELRAYQIINFWKDDHYRWVYHTVLQDEDQLRKIFHDINI